MTLKIKLRYLSHVDNYKTFFFSVAHDTSNPFDTLSICGSQSQDGFVKYLMGSVDIDGKTDEQACQTQNTYQLPA